MTRIYKLTVILISALVISPSCKWEQKPQKVTASAGYDLIDTLLLTAVNNEEIPGAVACIARNGSIVYKKAFGWRNIEKNIAMQEDDIFRMASMTKGLTAVAILQFYEKGLLFLYDNIS
jgi:CubicO group peptidase (beta-lactamase class C family)